MHLLLKISKESNIICNNKVLLVYGEKTAIKKGFYKISFKFLIPQFFSPNLFFKKRLNAQNDFLTVNVNYNLKAEIISSNANLNKNISYNLDLELKEDLNRLFQIGKPILEEISTDKNDKINMICKFNSNNRNLIFGDFFEGKCSVKNSSTTVINKMNFILMAEVKLMKKKR